MCRRPTLKQFTNNINTIIDSGATCTVWKPNDEKVTKLQRHTPIHAQGPSGHEMVSTGEGRLNRQLPEGMPNDILDGRYMPTLQNHSIISIGKIVDAGGICTFDQNECKCYHPTKGNIISGERRQNGLWYLTPQQSQSCQSCPTNSVNNTVTSMHQHTRIKDTIQFLHAALFSAHKSTIKKATKAGFLSTWPLLTPSNVAKYLTETIATKKGHLARVKKNIRSTKRIQTNEEDPFDIEQEHKTHEVFLVILDTQNMKETAYSDLMGAFPYTAANGDRYIFVFYSYDANAILLECMNGRSEAEML